MNSVKHPATDSIFYAPKSSNLPKRRGYVRNALVLCITTSFLLAYGILSYSGVLSKRRNPWSIEAINLKPEYRPHPLNKKEIEHIFLSIPNAESAKSASRAYATHPHFAGSSEDYEDALTLLHLFQKEFGIKKSTADPIFAAGTPESQQATLHLTSAVPYIKPSAWIDTYYPILNEPLEQKLEVIGDDGQTIWKAELSEDGDPRDEDAHKYKNFIPTWHALSSDGDVTGQVVYANYGTAEDYDELVAKGVNFTGKIVITRYGANLRGLKVKFAEDLGAIGVLIYSDPRDDGYATVSNGYVPYPGGPARNPTSVQRGSVEYVTTYPGDPTTPNYPAYPNAERKEPTNIPKIPSLPISWANAERLLEEIGENVMDGSKQKLSGKVSQTKTRLVNHVRSKVTPIWNTMASIPGHIQDEVIVIGCHRDAWVLGAADPTSGTVSLHEIIQAFGALLRKGWKPLRTILFTSWDGEEFGIVGSTEWAEDFSAWISEHVVAYLNVDTSVSGSRWSASASPSLSWLIRDAALEIAHPTIPQKSLWEAREDEGPFYGRLHSLNNGTIVDTAYMERYNDEARKRKASKTGVSPLGSGSDFTVFLQRLGIASADEGFSGTPSDAAYHYHSIYDSQTWQEKYADPTFRRHVAVAKHLGLLGLRLADSIVLPLNTTQYSLELDGYLDEVEKLVLEQPVHNTVPSFSTLRKSIRKLQNASLQLDKEKAAAEQHFRKLLKKIQHRGHRHLSGNTWKRFMHWSRNIFVLNTGCNDLQALLTQDGGSWTNYLKYTTDKYTVECAFAVSSHFNDISACYHIPFIRKFIKAAKRISKVNKKLMAFERGFISEAGIKDREWYKHLGVAPGKLNGYGATTFPALSEALTIDRNIELAELEAKRLVELLDELSEMIRP